MYVINPLTDERWTPFVERHPDSCAFHTRGWLQALALTYDYRPIGITSCPPEQELTDAVPLCHVNSWATGRRLVSLPFTDHCQPLLNSDNRLAEMIAGTTELKEKEKCKFAELRPARPLVGQEGNHCSTYAIHWLDLSPALEAIVKSFDKDSIQRKIRRAEREGLQYEDGRSPELIRQFYALMLLTRRRHQLPPQPIEWFQNLAQTMGESIQFRIALKDQQPVAAIVTLTHRNSIIYKYGCSDERFHATGSMPFLFWRMIQEAKSAGIPMVDFGRSDLDNPGLIRFKDQWGTRRSELTYYRFPAGAHERASSGFAKSAAKAVFERLPDKLLVLVGRKIYRHIG